MAKTITTSQAQASTLDKFFSEKFARGSASEFTKGNNVSFGVAGTFRGILADESVAPISGASSIKFTLDALSLNDWFMSKSISLDPKQRGNTSSHTLYYTYDGNEKDIEVVVYDVTNDRVLTPLSSLLEKKANAARFVIEFTPPTNCTEIKYGFQVKVVNAGKILVFDDVEMSSDPFVYKQLSVDIGAKINESLSQVYLNNESAKLAFTGSATVEYNDGAIWNTATQRMEFKEAGYYSARVEINIQNTGTTTRNQSVFIKKNGAGVVAADMRTSNTGNTNTISVALIDSFFKADDYIEAFLYHNDVAGSGSITVTTAIFLAHGTLSTEHIVTPTSSVSPVRYKINTTPQTFVHNVESILDYSTIDYDDDSLFTSGVGFVSATNSWTIEPKYIAPKDGYYKVHAKLLWNSSATWAEKEYSTLKLHKNGSFVSHLRSSLGFDASGGGTNVDIQGSDTIKLLKGDYIQIKALQTTGGDLNTYTGQSYSYITIEAIAPTALLSAIPISYKNVNPNILINGDCRINQRGLFPVAPGDVLNTTYYSDRWNTYISGSNIQAEAIINTTNQPPQLSGSKSLRYNCTTATTTAGYLGMYQPVEDFALYAGKTIIMSAWVKSNSSNARLRIWDGITATQSEPHSGSGEWEFMTFIKTLSNNPTALLPQIIIYDNGNVDVAANEYIEFTSAKVELGSIVTEFVADSYGDSLRKCQRYCEVLFYSSKDYAFVMTRASTTVCEFTYPYKVTKYKDLNKIISKNTTMWGRDVARTTTYGLSVANVTNFSISSSGDKHLGVFVVTTVAQPTGLLSCTFDTLGANTILVESEL